MTDCKYTGTGVCTCKQPEPAKAAVPLKLEDLLDHCARDYREMASGFGPVVPDFKACWQMAGRLFDAAERIRSELRSQEELAATGNEYSECVVQVLDRLRETS